MGLTSALVDRARVVTNESTGRKVDGTTLMAETTGPWFRARLMFDTAPAKVDEQGERRKILASPSLMFGVKDEDGGVLDVTGDLQIEVASVELGTATWRTTGDPQPIRKKRRVIGGTINLQRVVERPREGVR